MFFNTEATDCVEVSVKHTRGILVRKRKLWYVRSFNTGFSSGFLKKLLLSDETIRYPLENIFTRTSSRASTKKTVLCFYSDFIVLMA